MYTHQEKIRLAKGYAAALLVVCFWSGFNIVSRIGGRSELTPFDMVAIRVGVSGILLGPFFFIGRRSIAFRQSLVLAALGGLGYVLLIYSGFVYAPAAHAGVLVNGGIPFMTALLAWAASGHQPGHRAILSLVIAALGIVLISVKSFNDLEASASSHWLGDLYFLCAAGCFAVFGLLLKRWRVHPWEATFTIATISMLVYMPIYAVFLPKGIAAAPTSQILLQCFYQGVIAASVSSLLYAYANQAIGPMRASLMLAVVPGTTALAAVPLLGEPLSALSIFGVLLVTCGAILGSTSQLAR